MAASGDGAPVVGQQYGVSCTVLFSEGITSSILVEWYGIGGLLSTGNGVTIRNSQLAQSNITSRLVFSPFRTIHGGRYSCRVTIMSQAPPFNVSKAADIDIIATGEFYIMTICNVTYCICSIVVMALPVSIIPSPPTPEAGAYQAGSSITLTCQVQGGYAPLTYSWNSTCDGVCFALGETTNSISKAALHSVDTGNYTCTVTDYTGRTGSATIQISLSGQ